MCENEGCCYDTMTSPNCYYSNAEGIMSFLFSVSSIQKFCVMFILTASKQSLRRLCFHKRLPFLLSTERRRGSASRGVCIWGVCIQRRGVCIGECASREGGLHRGGRSAVCIQGGLHLRGLGRPPHRILQDKENKQAVRILCIFVNVAFKLQHSRRASGQKAGPLFRRRYNYRFFDGIKFCNVL